MVQGVRAYPVVFAYEELVKGRGFLAGVLARGRALMVHEHGEWWMYGVQPGVLAEGGETFDEARLLFREAFREMLFDLAEQSTNFDAFKTETIRVLSEVSGPMLARWNVAVQQLRAGKTEVEEPLRDLRKVPAEATPVEFHVAMIQPSTVIVPDNKVDEFSLAHAA
jgi:hypothetical protein